jgi:hypothetical protein
MSGYSKNPATAEKMLSVLGPLIQGELCTWQTDEGEADYFAYKVREALYVARLRQKQWDNTIRMHDEEGVNFPNISTIRQLSAVGRMAERIRIVVTSRSTVEARFAKGTPEALVLTSNATPTSGYENSGRSVVTITKQSAWSVKEAWKASQPSNTPLHFPHAELSYEELVELYEWATPLGLLLFEVDGALTVQRKTLDLVQFAWAPNAAAADVPEDEFPFKD